MGLCLAEMFVLAMSLETFGSYLSGGLQAALGLGLVIFVHELGHFAVAKWCGVQCDKFMIGFDIGGYKIGRQWGETYYGIGILPLGGYVKMMGQDDDPSKFKEQAMQSQAEAGDTNAKEITGPNGEKFLVDRRSYMAKSVPQRMAIISAGVIMNVIFAFVFAFIAFGMGVPQAPAVAQGTSPGGAAWRANLRTGDRVTRIGDIDNPTYEAFMGAVIFGSNDQGVSVDVERASGETISDLSLVPEKVGALQRVGIPSSIALRVSDAIKKVEHSPVAKLEQGFEKGDVITAVNGVAVKDYAGFYAAQIPLKNETITYTVLRGAKPSGSDPNAYEGGEQVEVVVPANPMERLGIVPVLGPIAAIQQDSPAQAAGLQAGDQLLTINGFHLGAAPDGETSWDPLTLDDRLAELAAAGETIALRVQRGDGEPIEIALQPRLVTWNEQPAFRAPISIPALGVACPIEAEVAAIVDGSPAQSTDLQPGDKIIKAELVLDDKPLKNAEGEPVLKKPIEFSQDERNWPFFITSMLQDRAPGTQAKLTVVRASAERTVHVDVATLPSTFAFARGIPLTPLKELRSASSTGEQAAMALSTTTRNLTMVYQLISKIFSGDVPATVIGGPLAILDAGTSSANQGLGSLLLFLTMLSANLAVLNFLPIPVLDGGHMVFLTYEGLRGRPANETFVIAANLFGFALLLSLMVFVFGLDLEFFDRGL